jgi:hypothetical protein
MLPSYLRNVDSAVEGCMLPASALGGIQMKSLILLMVLSACCFAQDLQMGELHDCSSSKPIGIVAVQNCDAPLEKNSFYHMMTPDGHEYVFARKWPSDRVMGRVYYRMDGDKVTVYWAAGPLVVSPESKKLFTRTVLASQVLDKATE